MPSQSSDMGSQPGGGHSPSGMLQPGFDSPQTQLTSGGGQPSSTTPSQLLSLPSHTSGPHEQPLSMTPSQSSSLLLPHTSVVGLQQPSSIMPSQSSSLPLHSSTFGTHPGPQSVGHLGSDAPHTHVVPQPSS